MLSPDLDPTALRAAIRRRLLQPEADAVAEATDSADLTAADRARIREEAIALVERVRTKSRPSLMEGFLTEYGLSTTEGVALMCLAEALLRVPDADTIDALIEDKIAPSDWGRHLGRSASSLVNASSWGLMLTGRVLRDDAPGLAGALHGAVRRLGEPVIRTAVGQAMKELGRQFVLGRNIDEALKRAETRERQGYGYSYDMLGEAARTWADADRYAADYARAIDRIAKRCRADRSVAENPGISVKLSALHPRYEEAKRAECVPALIDRVRPLARAAAAANMGFNIDAEEADRLDLSLDIIDGVLSDPTLEGWDGFGVVVQAYGQRAGAVIDWLYALAARRDRRIMVRLVKGAYWDSEIKRAQVQGIDGFPVFTRKASTDVNYIGCAAKLIRRADRLYPQFATHNAATVTAIRHLVARAGLAASAYEFQRLHGMGEALHDLILADHGSRCRIYAPVGAHRDLLAYLVRRLLENGANSSFVHQLVDPAVPPARLAEDPFETVEKLSSSSIPNPAIPRPADLYAPNRRNSRGLDLADPQTLAWLEEARAPFRTAHWSAAPTAPAAGAGEAREVINPANPQDRVGSVTDTDAAGVHAAATAARTAWPVWSATPISDRAACLERAADALEEVMPEMLALLAREAGKTLPDGVAEVREAVDFLRYYAATARDGEIGPGRGVLACISPWNFPLAIFTGQIAAALVAGNAVLAKPAEQTPLTAARMIAILHGAGIPGDVLFLLPGPGETVGAALSALPGLDGLCFTGSTDTAIRIDRAMATEAAPGAPLIAETGGLNAMIVDSTALPEQVVRDVLASAFQSAGQRCSACRIVYVQEDVADTLETMLAGAMATLEMCDPWHLATDVGPVIEATAKAEIDTYIRQAQEEGRLVTALTAPEAGHFVGPALIRVPGIEAMDREMFGPVLHIARFKAQDLDGVIDAINAKGYGLTFGLHTRIDDRVQAIVDRIRCGNVYVNRNQVGAVVGTQPFGGEGLSGTGPKAGGPGIVPRLAGPYKPRPALRDEPEAVEQAAALPPVTVQAAIDRAAAAFRPAPLTATDLPGPTGESNRLSVWPRGVVLCLGPGAEAAEAQAEAAQAHGCAAVIVTSPAGPVRTDLGTGETIVRLSGRVEPSALRHLTGIAAVAYADQGPAWRDFRRVLAARPGVRLPVVGPGAEEAGFTVERHVCVDTTAAGGNASLLAAAG